MFYHGSAFMNKRGQPVYYRVQAFLFLTYSRCLQFVFSIVEEASKADWIETTLSTYDKFFKQEEEEEKEEQEEKVKEEVEEDDEEEEEEEKAKKEEKNSKSWEIMSNNWLVSNKFLEFIISVNGVFMNTCNE